MPANQNAREFLDYYLSLDDEPEFAVLLEGPWGSGKSHFVDVYFQERFERIKAQDPEAKNPLIHVTLFGVRDLSDITTQMFERAHPVLGGKAVRILNNLGSRVAGVIGLGLDAKENASALQSMVLDLSDRILVFDDLERSPLPIVEVMGFINGFVEHDKVKVLVVASEEDIPDDQKEEYKRRKEKLVGKTVRVGSDPTEVLSFFQKKLKQPEVLSAIEENRDEILTTFSSSGRPNFRSLRAVLFDFQRLMMVADERLRTSEVARSQLLLCMIALGVEFRSNNLDENALRSLQSTISFRSNSGQTKKPQSEVRTDAGELQERYSLVSFEDPIVPLDCLADLFASGLIDVQKINEHLSKHPTVVGQAETPPWRLMWSWDRLSQTEYEIARSRFLNELECLTMTHPGQVLHAAGSVLRLKKYGDDLIDNSAVLDYFESYLADLNKKGGLEPAPELFGEMGGSYAGLVYNEHDSEEFAVIHQKVAEAALVALQRRMEDAAPELLSRLQERPDDGSMLYEWGLAEGKFAGTVILSFIDVNAFADLVLIDGKPNDQLLSALRERYVLDPNASLAPEYDWLAHLCEELIQRTLSLSPPYQAFAKMRLEYWFREM